MAGRLTARMPIKSPRRMDDGGAVALTCEGKRNHVSLDMAGTKTARRIRFLRDRERPQKLVVTGARIVVVVWGVPRIRRDISSPRFARTFLTRLY